MKSFAGTEKYLGPSHISNDGHIHLKLTCSKPTVETLEKGVNMLKAHQNDITDVVMLNIFLTFL